MSFWQTLDAGEKALALQATVGAGTKPADAARLLQTSPSAIAGHLYARPDGRKPVIRGARGARVLLRIIAVRGAMPVAPPSGGRLPIPSNPAPPPEASAADVAAVVPPSAQTSADPTHTPVTARGRKPTSWGFGFGPSPKNAVPKSAAQDLAALAAAAIDAGQPVTKCPPAHADGSVLTSYETIGR